MLTDRELRYWCGVRDALHILPMPEDRQFQPASIDLRLAETFLVPKPCEAPISVNAPPQFESMCVPKVILHPGEFLLASTVERIELGPRFAARVEGRSTLGRMGITVHVTAGFIDPGFAGRITLEIANLGPWKVELLAGMRIAQLCVYYLSSDVERPYGHPALGSKYQGQLGVAPPTREK